jgi:fatty acid-binding protein DegV
MSKTGAFFGDVLHIKPIVSPYPDGARKIGVVRNIKDQVKFAFHRLEQNILRDQKATLLLEYSDNKEWLEGEIKPEIERRFPLVQIIIQPLSLTTAAHVGPGSWGIAFLTESPQKDDSYV